MRVARVKSCDINNGKGLMVSLWTQGCSKHCPDCHNKKTWDFDGGIEYTKNILEEILNLLKYPQNLAILGGEPLEKCNLTELLELTKIVKEKYPKKEIWLWTGSLFEDVCKLQVFENIDYCIDGCFVKELYNKDLKYRGSSNQRVIDVQKSLKQGQVVLSKYN